MDLCKKQALNDLQSQVANQLFQDQEATTSMADYPARRTVGDSLDRASSHTVSPRLKTATNKEIDLVQARGLVQAARTQAVEYVAHGALRAVEGLTEMETMLASVRDVLRDQRAKQMTERVAAGTTWQGADDDTELVFTTRSGRPIEARNVYRSFQRICTQHGIRRITLHGLRHTNATTQKSLKVHDRDIQAILGHGDVRTTGIYTHVDLGSKRAALEKVEDLLLDDEQEVRGRCRQISRHEQRAVVSGMPQGATKESIHLWWVDTFFGGSSQTRTGDTRLFRPLLYQLS
jgi:hypothetical protein